MTVTAKGMHIVRLAFLSPAVTEFVLAALTLNRMIEVIDDSLVSRIQFSGVAFFCGILLLLGMRKPVERARILQPPAIVIGCIAAAFLLGFAKVVISIARMLLVMILSATKIWLCWAGLTYARDQGTRDSLKC